MTDVVEVEPEESVEPVAEEQPEQEIVTMKTKDYLGRSLVNATPGTSNATDFLGRSVQAGDKDYLGRLLQ
jgi:hypothetical protein